MKRAKLYGYSDDCANVEVDGKDIFDDEYTDKRLRIKLPSGEEIIATLLYDGDWRVDFEIPSSCEVIPEEWE